MRVAFTEFASARMHDDVDDLRQVNDDAPSILNEDVMSGQTAAGVAGSRHRAEAFNQLLPRSSGCAAVQRMRANRGAASLYLVPMNSIQISAPRIWTGYGTATPADHIRRKALNSVYAHWAASLYAQKRCVSRSHAPPAGRGFCARLGIADRDGIVAGPALCSV